MPATPLTEIMRTEPKTAGPYVERFAAARESLPGAGLAWLRRLRSGAIEMFAANGFPTAKVEEWKYSNLAALAETPYALAPAAVNGIAMESLGPVLLEQTPCHRVVLVNGRRRADLSDIGSLPAGVAISGLAEALSERADLVEAHFGESGALVEERLSGQRDPRPFALTALNAAFATDGAVIFLPRGTELAAPVHVLHVAAPAAGAIMAHPRNLVIAEPGARATIVETFVGAGAGAGGGWTNAVTMVSVGAGAEVRHYKLQAEAATASHTAATHVALARDGHYSNFVLSVGGGLSRNEIRVRFDGEGVSCRLDGAYLARGAQRMDNWTRVDHLKPRGATEELYKGVVDGAAHAAFQGKIRVWPDAVKSDARQLNHNLLLAEGAQVASKPELEILADDVKCSHGSTVGALDDAALFYLRSRGVDEGAARRLLVEAFIGELICSVEDAAAQRYFTRAFTDWLAAPGAG